MKFAHLADCHIGSWRDPKLKDISLRAFVRAVDISIDKGVDFVLISGDLFNTSLPSIDGLKEATKKLKELNDKNIAVYIIAGSHDFSPSGKTMLDVLENAGLCINVAKGEIVSEKLKLNFTVDKKTGVKITGLLGRRGGLDRLDYEKLNKDYLEKMSKIMKNKWKIKEYREKVIKSILIGSLKRPTSLEKQMIEIINKYKLPYKYVGNGSFLIGYKNPDFININGEKKLIEVGNVFHHQGDYKEKREEHFKKYGWKGYFF